jgi:hypothetical protein
MGYHLACGVHSLLYYSIRFLNDVIRIKVLVQI